MFSFPERFRLIMEGEADYNRGKERMAVAYIKAHPREFLEKSWSRVLDTWSARHDSWADGWIAALHLSREDVWLCSAFSVVSFAGLLLALRTNGMDSLPLAMCLVVFPIPYYITHTALRYRHPIDPLMTIFAVYAMSRLWSALISAPGDGVFASDDSGKIKHNSSVKRVGGCTGSGKRAPLLANPSANFMGLNRGSSLRSE